MRRRPHGGGGAAEAEGGGAPRHRALRHGAESPGGAGPGLCARHACSLELGAAARACSTMLADRRAAGASLHGVHGAAAAARGRTCIRGHDRDVTRLTGARKRALDRTARDAASSYGAERSDRAQPRSAYFLRTGLNLNRPSASARHSRAAHGARSYLLVSAPRFDGENSFVEHGEVVHQNHRPIRVKQLLKHQMPRANRNRSHEQRLEELWRLRAIAERVDDMRRSMQPGPPAALRRCRHLWWLGVTAGF